MRARRRGLLVTWFAAFALGIIGLASYILWYGSEAGEAQQALAQWQGHSYSVAGDLAVPLTLWVLVLAFVGVAIALADRTPVRHTRACPACAETVLADATRCRFCGEPLSPTAARSPS